MEVWGVVPDAPVEDDTAGRLLGVEDALRGGVTRQEHPVGRGDIHPGDDHVGRMPMAVPKPHPADAVRFDFDAVHRGVEVNVDTEGQGRLVQGVHDGVHAADRGERAHSEFEVGDDVEHGRRPVGIAAIVGGKPVEELLEVGVPGPGVPRVESMGKGQGPPGMQGPAEVAGGPDRGPARGFVQALFEEQAPRGVEAFLAQVEVV